MIDGSGWLLQDGACKISLPSVTEFESITKFSGRSGGE
jgi:hypothetical protein